MVLACRWPRRCLLARYQGCRGSAHDHGGSTAGQPKPHGSRVQRDRSAVASPFALGRPRSSAITRDEFRSERNTPRNQKMPVINIPFVLSVVGAFLTSSAVAYIYVWPAVRALPRFDALRLLAA